MGTFSLISSALSFVFLWHASSDSAEVLADAWRRGPAYRSWSVSCMIVSRSSWRVSVWSVCFDWREACLPSWCNWKHYIWARIPEIQVRIPSRAMGTFFPHTVSSIFRLSLTHTHTHTLSLSHTHTLTEQPDCNAFLHKYSFAVTYLTEGWPISISVLNPSLIHNTLINRLAEQEEYNHKQQDEFQREVRHLQNLLRTRQHEMQSLSQQKRYFKKCLCAGAVLRDYACVHACAQVTVYKVTWINRLMSQPFQSSWSDRATMHGLLQYACVKEYQKDPLSLSLSLSYCPLCEKVVLVCAVFDHCFAMIIQ